METGEIMRTERPYNLAELLVARREADAGDSARKIAKARRKALYASRRPEYRANKRAKQQKAQAAQKKAQAARQRGKQARRMLTIPFVGHAENLARTVGSEPGRRGNSEPSQSVSGAER